jgi:DNA-binding NarL/FixJ family response regulator
MKSPIRLLIADDSRFIRESLRNLIAKEPTIELVAEAKDGAEAVDLIEQHKPDVVLLDVSMRHPDEGFEVARELRQRKSPVRVIYLSGQDYSEAVLREFVHRALELKAVGFVLKSGSSEEIIESIKTVASNQRYFSGRLTPYLLDLRDRRVALEHRYPGLHDLTNQERCILLLLAEAMTSKEMAKELGISSRTIDNHLGDIRSKLNLKGHNLLLKFAIEHKTELRIMNDSSV